MLLIADVFPKLKTLENGVKEMSKKCRIIDPFEEQHGKGDQTMLKSEPHPFYHICC